LKNKVHAFAVVRRDEFLENPDSLEDIITIKEVVWTQEQAESEVSRLNALNAHKGVKYFWRMTRVEANDRTLPGSN
jgi:hypothetical protein